MSDIDIVIQLKRIAKTMEAGHWVSSSKAVRDAAAEIERLRKEAFHLAANQCHAGYGGEYGHHRCREIDRLTAERDEARRETCYELSGWKQSTHEQEARAEAKRRGWDCFKENTNV